MSDEPYSRKGFFRELFGHVRRGVSSNLEARLQRMLDTPLRPPGALDELEFLSTCTRCEACVRVCPFGAIQRKPVDAGVAANTPYIDPATQACRLCEDFPCIAACEPHALLPLRPEQVQMGRARVDEEACMTFTEDKVCTLCYDACPFPEHAITIDEAFHPRVLDACVGCGACHQRCPVYPVGIEALSPMAYRARRNEEELYFGVIRKEDEQT